MDTDSQNNPTQEPPNPFKHELFEKLNFMDQLTLQTWVATTVSAACRAVYAKTILDIANFIEQIINSQHENMTQDQARALMGLRYVLLMQGSESLSTENTDYRTTDE
jgi:hypothetical protein